MPLGLRAWLTVAVLAPLSLALGVNSAAAEDAPAVDFVRDVQPILTQRCHQCHGAEHHESGLRLDQRTAALAGGDSGPAIELGRAAESELVRRIESPEDSERMPPADAGDPLTAGQIATIRAWIDQGATWPAEADTQTKTTADHWSYRAIARPELPAVDDEGWVRHPIDRFVLARLEQAGVRPSPEADRATLIKRLYYDLVGLPPEPAAVDAFLADDRPDAYDLLVEQLLASPHFGERWGRHWLDLARYADSDGYEKDNPRPDAWRYRDWVISAINRDLPLDQFALQQLAGDLLPDATPDQRLATAFHRQTLTNTEGGADQEQFRVEALFDRTNTLGAVWLGLTVGCAQCHSHKYDQISHKEYYQLFAFFDNADEANAEVAISPEALAQYDQAQQAHRRRAAELARDWLILKLELTSELVELERAIELQLADAAARTLDVRPLEVLEMTSSSGVTYTRLEDGSYLASGENPAKEIVTLIAALPEGSIHALRVDALAHDSLPAKGPGRAGHGNFVLHELRVQPLAAPDAKPGQRLGFASARASFSQDGFPAERAVDGDDKTGWAIAPQLARDQRATFDLAEPTPETLRYVRIELRQRHGQQHTLGRFRISTINGLDPDAIAPADIRVIVALSRSQRSPQQRTALEDFLAARHPRGAELRRRIDEHLQNEPARPYMKVRVIRQRGEEPRTTHILRRGDFLQPADPVTPGMLDCLPPLVSRREGQPPDRLDLARWLFDPAQPLVPRVTVNQVWSHLFGAGLVETPNDFGARGVAPSHAELLDWLACELRAHGFSRKALIRQIVTSATYRQSSAHRPELIETDPQNRLLARQNRLRVEAEIVRDLYLAAAGLLARRVGGPSVFPPMPEDIAKLSYADNFRWENSTGDERYRRGMYTFFKRTAPHPNLTTFDCPDANTTCIQRQTSNTPLQALATLNETAFVEAARHLALRTLRETASDDAARLTHALRLCIARPPATDELERAAGLLDEARAWYAQHPADAEQLIDGLELSAIDPAEAAAWMTTCRVFLNLDEFVTRE